MIFNTVLRSFLATSSRPRHTVSMPWLFGYGSIVWRPNLQFLRQRPALLKGWGRTFNQGSYDHRGTPDHPGRVLTLRQNVHRECHGVAFEISDTHWVDTLSYLDHREKGGYVRTMVDVVIGGRVVSAVSYIAPPGNPHDTGSETVEEIAAVSHIASGPSGTNREYLLALMKALEHRQIKDSYLDLVMQAFLDLDRLP